MGELKDQMIKMMELKNFSRKTIKCYLMYMKEYVRYYRKAPDKMGEEEIVNYLYYLKNEKKASYSGINLAYSALKYFYENVIGRQWDVKKIPRQKGIKRLPVVLSRQEVKNILEGVSNEKQRIALMTTYSAGLRISETTKLKVSDIDSSLMQIRIVQGKGEKDRYSILSVRLLEELRKYYKKEKPKEWLFPGQDKNSPIHQSTLQRAFNQSKKKQG
jgi:integrase/recombinase XerD